MTVAYQPALGMSVAGFNQLPIATANRLLEEWGHYLGPCLRPFGQQAWALDVAGQPVAVAVTASIVSPTVAGYALRQVVELARLCSAPTARWATRPTLRLWREVAAPRWADQYPDWTVNAAVAYSQNDRHDGRSYRFDGWTRVDGVRGKEAGAGSTWSKQRDSDHPARGPKALWIWRYPQPVTAVT